MSERVAIQLETLTRLADGFRESRGISGNLTTEQMITLAATPISSGPATNKLPQILDRTVTEITAEDLAGVTEIGNCAFYKCENLTNVTIPDSVTSIGDWAFFDTKMLKKITIGKGVTKILGDAFASNGSRHCDLYINDLESWCKVSLSGGKSNPCIYGGNLYVNNILLTEFVSPNSISKINNYTFYGCESITDIKITDNVSNMGLSVFNQCVNLKSAIISNCSNYGNYAFTGCSNLKIIRFGKIYGLNSTMFQGCTSLIDIYIDAPEDSISGAPWGAPNSPTIHWNTPLPTEEE